MGGECLKHSVGDASPIEGQGVGPRQHRPFYVAETLRHLPVRNGGNLVLVDAHLTTRLAVLGEHELALHRPPDPGLGEFTQLGVKGTTRVAVQGEPRPAVVENVRRVGEHRPPVSRGARGGTRLVDGAPVTEHQLVPERDARVGFVAWDLSQSGHATVCP